MVDKGARVKLVDGTTSGAPYLQRVNDAHTRTHTDGWVLEAQKARERAYEHAVAMALDPFNRRKVTRSSRRSRRYTFSSVNNHCENGPFSHLRGSTQPPFSVRKRTVFTVVVHR